MQTWRIRRALKLALFSSVEAKIDDAASASESVNARTRVTLVDVTGGILPAALQPYRTEIDDRVDLTKSKTPVTLSDRVRQASSQLESVAYASAKQGEAAATPNSQILTGSVSAEVEKDIESDALDLNSRFKQRTTLANRVGGATPTSAFVQTQATVSMAGAPLPVDVKSYGDLDALDGLAFSAGSRLAGAPGTVTPNVLVPTATAAANATIIPQLLAAIRTNGSGNSVEIRLDPPELGRVKIDLNMDGGADSVKAVLAAERAETLDYLRKNISALEEQLKQAGFSSISFDFSSYMQQRDAEERKTYDSGDAEALTTEQTDGNGNTVYLSLRNESQLDLLV